MLHPLGLASPDLNRSDPYLVLECNDERIYETSPRMHTRHPFWNEVYMYKTRDHCLPHFSIKVFNRDLIQDTCIGKADIPGHEIIRSLTTPGRFDEAGIQIKLTLCKPSISPPMGATQQLVANDISKAKSSPNVFQLDSNSVDLDLQRSQIQSMERSRSSGEIEFTTKVPQNKNVVEDTQTEIVNENYGLEDDGKATPSQDDGKAGATHVAPGNKHRRTKSDGDEVPLAPTIEVRPRGGRRKRKKKQKKQNPFGQVKIRILAKALHVGYDGQCV